MRSTVILPIEDNKDFLKSIMSIIENTVKPTNICIVSNCDISKNSVDIINVFFNSCCNQSSITYEQFKDYNIKIATNNNITYTYIQTVKNLNLKDLHVFAIQKMYDKTDVYMSLSSGSIYMSNCIEKILKKFEDRLTGIVYSDYISNEQYQYLSTIHSLVNYFIPIKEMAFSKEVINKDAFVLDPMEVIRNAFDKALVRYIPEALFIT